VIFISYVRDDTGRDGSARRVRDAFVTAVGDASVFFDEASIGPGAEWSTTIERGLERASALVLVLGPRWRDAALPKLSAEGEVVRREVLAAHGARRPVIPVIVDDAIPRVVDSPGLPLLADVQWESLADSRSEEQLGRLVDRVLDVIVHDDVARLSRPRRDPVVSGLDELLAMTVARRRAVSRVLESGRAGEGDIRRAGALVRIALDPLGREGPGPDRVDGLAGLLLEARGLRLLEVGTPALRNMRSAARQLLATTEAGVDVLDRCLLLGVDAALDRAAWVADRSGSGRPTSLEQARELLEGRARRSRTGLERVAAHVFGTIITVSDAALAADLSALRPWRTPRLQRPHPSGRRAPVHRARRRR
jgi:hypothetical protein